MPPRPTPFRPQPLAPNREGLYDPSFERDSCGVGFVAHLDGRRSHATVQSGLQLLRNLQHRGACGCDQDTGDGAGILLQMPDAFFRAEADRHEIELPPPGDYAVAFAFLPRKGLERTVEVIQLITGQPELLDNMPVLKNSIQRRNPYIDALSFVQLVLLRRLRAGPELRAELLSGVLESINGIASGLKNTG